MVFQEVKLDGIVRQLWGSDTFGCVLGGLNGVVGVIGGHYAKVQLASIESVCLEQARSLQCLSGHAGDGIFRYGILDGAVYTLSNVDIDAATEPF